MIQLSNIYKAYQLGDMPVPVLNGVDLQIEAGEFVAIMGPSGSGKTTLLNIIGCLDSIDQGSYQLAGKQIDTRNDKEMAQIRSLHIGFVFQLFNLIPRISAERNVEIPMIYANIPHHQRKQRVHDALTKVGLTDRAKHIPTQLSGGQQQRVAIARALVNNPDLLVADEPTGSLDSSNGKEIMKMFQRLNEEGVTIIMVTHETDIAVYAKRRVHLLDGRVQTDPTQSTIV